MLDGLSTAVVIVSHSLLVRDLNPAAENLLGISHDRACGDAFLPLVDNDPTFADILEQALVTNSVYVYETTLAPHEAASQQRTVDCRVSPLTLADEPRSLVIEMTDVTRRARITRENALLIQHGAGRQMVRQLAHEIKNPLGGLRGAAQLLSRQLASAELKEYTDVIISEADRLAGLVDTLLGPGGPLKKRRTNMHELLEYVLRLVEPEMSERIRVHRDYDPGLPDVLLDHDRIVQALLNLLQNALTALDGQGQLTVRTRAELNFTIGDVRHPLVLTVEIEDDGPGIPAELQDTVFYPLVTSRADGTGLGLPAAQELLSRHGGLIEFVSRPGQTVFSVHVPLDRESVG